MSIPAISALVTAMLLILAAVSFALRMRAFERKVAQLLAQAGNRERIGKENVKRDQQTVPAIDLRSELAPLFTAIANIPAETARHLAHIAPRVQEPAPVSTPLPVAPFVTYDEPEEDVIGRLLALADRIVKESSTTLDAFRTSTNGLGVQVSAYPNPTDGSPLAFIVEHRGTCYAVPNVVKPKRLPQSWFNGSDFGVNDEIQRIVSLPRLRRNGSEYEVLEAGVFTR